MWKETSWFSCFGPTWSLFVNFHNGQMKLKPWPRFDKGRLWAKFQLDWKSETMSMSPIFFSVRPVGALLPNWLVHTTKSKKLERTLKLFLWVLTEMKVDSRNTGVQCPGSLFPLETKERICCQIILKWKVGYHSSQDRQYRVINNL